jgi:hypothetical protein
MQRSSVNRRSQSSRIADLFASQVSGGVDRPKLQYSRQATGGVFCIASPCLEWNYRGVATKPPLLNDVYKDQIRRLLTLYHALLGRRG